MTARTARQYPVVIEAATRPALFGLADLWRYRGLIRLMAARDVKLRFRQTRFGAAWLIVNPLLFTLGYAFLFGTIGKVAVGGHNYFLFTYVGISLWTAFSSVFNRTSNCLLGNRELLTHAYFPRLAVPLSSACAAQVDVLISWTMLIAFLQFSGEGLGVGLLLLPLWFLVAQALALALGLMVASWTLAFRDLQNLTAVVLAMGPIFTPVAYPKSALPESFRFLATANPLTPLFDGMRASAFGGAFPSSVALAFSFSSMVALALVAASIFRLAERRLADVI